VHFLMSRHAKFFGWPIASVRERYEQFPAGHLAPVESGDLTKFRICPSLLPTIPMCGSLVKSRTKRSASDSGARSQFYR
jgi:hypothetical protein